MRAALLLEAVAEAEQLTVTDEDVERKYAEIAGMMHQDPAAVKRSIDKDSLIAQLREEKALAFIISQATITER